MITLLLLPLLNSCADPFEQDSGKPIPFSPEAFVDSSPDADTDSDMDTDTDTDSDSDTDTDTDTDVRPTLVLNEVAGRNLSQAPPSQVECPEPFPDYIEIVNTTGEEAQLEGWVLVKRTGEDDREILLSGFGAVPANGFFVLWTSKNGTETCENFEIAENDVLILLQAGEETEQFTVPRPKDDVSVGRYPDGQDAMDKEMPLTPGAPNATE